jgi:hypothetical protein
VLGTLDAWLDVAVVLTKISKKTKIALRWTKSTFGEKKRKHLLLPVYTFGETLRFRSQVLHTPALTH